MLLGPFCNVAPAGEAPELGTAAGPADAVLGEGILTGCVPFATGNDALKAGWTAACAGFSGGLARFPVLL